MGETELMTNGQRVAGWFNPLVWTLDNCPCCFITAYRRENTQAQNICLNRLLEGNIKASGLTYYKTGAEHAEKDANSERMENVPEDCFCVVDNVFPPEDFRRLVLHWCRKHELDALLVMPRRGTDKYGRPKSEGFAQLYSKEGAFIGEGFANPGLEDVDAFFTRAFGKELTATRVEANETGGFRINTYNGRFLGHMKFKKLYPNLAPDENQDESHSPVAAKPLGTKADETESKVVYRLDFGSYNLRFDSIDEVSEVLFEEPGHDASTFAGSMVHVFENTPTLAVRVTFVLERNGHRFFELQNLARKQNSTEWKEFDNPKYVDFHIQPETVNQ